MADYPGFFLDDLVVGASRPRLPARQELMCRVHWRYTNLDGSPVALRRTLFVNIFVPSVRGADMIVGTFAEAQTDEAGEGEIRLFRGTECDVVIDQTHITARITVPDLPQSDLLDLIDEAPNMFSVQRANPTAPIRRSI